MNEGGWGGSREVDMNSVLSIEDKIIHYNTEEQQSAWGSVYFSDTIFFGIYNGYHSTHI